MQENLVLKVKITFSTEEKRREKIADKIYCKTFIREPNRTKLEIFFEMNGQKRNFSHSNVQTNLTNKMATRSRTYIKPFFFHDLMLKCYGLHYLVAASKPIFLSFSHAKCKCICNS